MAYEFSVYFEAGDRVVRTVFNLSEPRREITIALTKEDAQALSEWLNNPTEIPHDNYLRFGGLGVRQLNKVTVEFGMFCLGEWVAVPQPFFATLVGQLQLALRMTR